MTRTLMTKMNYGSKVRGKVVFPMPC
ncbi:hypothetical protein Golob_000483 [Gossypium lobatum]|uniref:Uncharacterized protein n=2 Tax=Gossypium TaxID=3633 RepID=A0A7J8YGX1_GOSAI|nr:hypothetical protein [Gossypium lobatum]MBA0698825.1 hypothetical protein [Gossypium aridum]